MARKAKKAKRAFSQEHRAALKKAALRRGRKSKAAAAESPGARKKPKIVRSHEGIRILVRQGGGKDIVQGNAEEIIRAVRAVKEMCRTFGGRK
jgi:hypothetical protein